MAQPVVKLFGERNTGTTFLARLITANYDVQLLRSSFMTPALAAALEARTDNPMLFQLLKEYEVDRATAAAEPEHLGWKHSCVPPDLFERAPYEELRVVCITRNPYAFMRSLLRHPYHGFMLPKPRKLLELTNTPWKTVARDRVEAAFLDSPVQLWNLKVASYFRLQERHPDKVLILRYEELVAAPDLAFDSLDALLGQAGRRQVPMEAVKQLTGWRRFFRPGFSVYARRAARFDPQSLGAEALEAINRYLDPEVVAQAGYAMVPASR